MMHIHWAFPEKVVIFIFNEQFPVQQTEIAVKVTMDDWLLTGNDWEENF